MEEQQYTVIVHEHTDQHGRFLAYEIHLTGRRVLWWPHRPLHSHARERLLCATRVANARPESWDERIAA